MNRLKHNKKGMETLIVLLGAIVIIGLIMFFGINQLQSVTTVINQTWEDLNDCYKISNSFCISPNDYCREYDNSMEFPKISCKDDDNPGETADMKCCIAIDPKKKITLELYNGDKYIDRLAGRTQDYLSTGGLDKVKITSIEVNYPEYLYSKKINNTTTKFKLELVPLKTTTKCHPSDKPIVVKCDYSNDGDFSFPSCGNPQTTSEFNLDIGDCRFKLTVYDEKGEDVVEIFTKEFDFPVKI